MLLPSAPLNAVLKALATALMPDPDIGVDEWSDQYQIIPKDSGAAEAGKYRTERTPHARTVMQCLSSSHPCKKVVIMGASQMLKTQVGLNWLMATIHTAPSNFLWVAPSESLVKRASARIETNIEAVPEIRERVAKKRSRDSSNTINRKEYPGGSLNIVTSGSAKNLAEISVRYVFFDECDRTLEDVGGEGDAVALALARQTTFERTRKAYLPSSPLIKGESIIERLYLAGTQRHALADCPHCHTAQPLAWDNVIELPDGDAGYTCQGCGAVLTEQDKPAMFARGAWSDGVQPLDGETESFTINALFLPLGWMPWRALLGQFKSAKKADELGDDSQLKTFMNTRLALPYEQKKEYNDADTIRARAEPYRVGTIPHGPVILTAGVDTQLDRLEVLVIGWGRGLEAWVIDYQIIHGNPAEDDVWRALDAALSVAYQTPSGGVLVPKITFVDSGGAHTQSVYDHILPMRKARCIKGSSYLGDNILHKKTRVDVSWRGETVKGGVELWILGTHTAKDYLSARLKIESGEGQIHFPADLPDHFYTQLTAEYRTGGRWICPKGQRNEAWDMLVYAMSATHYLGLHRLPPDGWTKLEAQLQVNQSGLFAPAPPPAPALPTPASETKPETPQTPVDTNKVAKPAPRMRVVCNNGNNRWT